MKLLSILLLIVQQSIMAHECIHSKIAAQMKIQKSELDEQDLENKRNLQNTNFRQITITADYSQMTTSATVTTAITDIIEKDVLTFYRSLMQVNGPTSIPKLQSNVCSTFAIIPVQYQTSTTTTDLLIFVTTVSDTENYLAYATACKVDSTTGRPIVGVIGINTNYLLWTNIAIEKLKVTLKHEIMHILIMSPDLMASFKSGSALKKVTVATKTGTFSNQSKVVSPLVVSLGKTHFNCTTFDGVLLENEGGSGSASTHWEKIILGNEMMTAQLNGNFVLSKFTLSLMQDSGWYLVDFTMAEELNWGKNKGCSFYDFTCNTKFEEFCTPTTGSSINTQNMCSTDYKSKMNCLSTSFSDNCFISEYVTGYNCFNNFTLTPTSPNEYGGALSRCFVTTNNNNVQKPGCYASNCVNGAIAIKVNGQTLTCTSTGQTLSFASVTITCPNPVDFCAQFSNKCSNDCSGVGTCAFGGCSCAFFYSGSDCNTPLTCSKSSSVCSLQGVTVPTNTAANPTPSSIGIFKLASMFLLSLVLNILN